MKRQTARLLRGVIRLIEDDVREIADSVVEIDQREAAHHADVLKELDGLRGFVLQANRYGIVTREMLLDAMPDNDDHSIRV